MEASARPSPAAAGETRPPRVLIADDNVQGAELLEAYLSGSGYELRTAADGEQTLQQVAAWQPDLILLDIMMPRISGFEVCKRLRADPATEDMAVLMITALDQPSDMDRAVEVGTDDFLSKPIKKSELLLRVRSLLRSRMYKRQLDRALGLHRGGGTRRRVVSSRQPREMPSTRSRPACEKTAVRGWLQLVVGKDNQTCLLQPPTTCRYFAFLYSPCNSWRPLSDTPPLAVRSLSVSVSLSALHPKLNSAPFSGASSVPFFSTLVITPNTSPSAVTP